MVASSGAGIFSTKPVPWLKEYLKQRGVQSLGNRKAELLELCVKSVEIKVPKISEEEEPVDPAISMKEQLKTTDEGYLTNLPLKYQFHWLKPLNLQKESPFGSPCDCLRDADNNCDLKELPLCL